MLEQAEFFSYNVEMKKSAKNTLTSDQSKKLLTCLKSRFEENSSRHNGIEWSTVQKRLDASPDKLWSLFEMERTGGEPDVIRKDEKSGEILFADCSAETPKDRRSLCFDKEALDSRKEHKPKGSAVEMAGAMSIDLLTEEQYRYLQELGKFDLKTSSWIQTPEAIRKLGGALFCDRRYDHVFVYHNGASSYYAVRGFRGCIKV